MKRDRFYKTSPHGVIGANVAFHSIDGSGYVTNIDDACIYTRSEAQSEVDSGWLRSNRTDEVFLSADHVDELYVWKVDHQHVSLSYPESKDPDGEYVICLKGVYDGNDLCFVANFNYSYNYSDARVFDEAEIIKIDRSDWVVLPKSHTDEIARRTFQWANINRRKMISSAGIVGIRKKRASRASGKTRWNCPCCGKIVWQYNPHEFMSCLDVLCDEYNVGYLGN